MGEQSRLPPLPPFLSKLYKILSNRALSRYICWCDGGATFLIKDPTGFAKDVLPQFFKHNNLRSMLRQLNAYGFRRSEDHVATGRLEFSHESFRAGRVDLLTGIQRSGAQGKREQDPQWIHSVDAPTPTDWQPRLPQNNDIAALIQQTSMLQESFSWQFVHLNKKLDVLTQSVSRLGAVVMPPGNGQAMPAGPILGASLGLGAGVGASVCSAHAQHPTAMAGELSLADAQQQLADAQSLLHQQLMYQVGPAPGFACADVHVASEIAVAATVFGGPV